MLTIYIPPSDGFNESTNHFVKFDGATIQLEHSLLSISKWESKWHKAFLGKEVKTEEEMRDYVRCMTVTQNVKDDVYTFLSEQNLKDINSYIADDMTASKFLKTTTHAANTNEKITSELVYYWMIASNIPFECQKWHLNRLLALIEVCSRKSAGAKGKRMSPKEISARNRELNAQRRAKLNSKG